MALQEQEAPRLLYDPHDFDKSPEPDFLREYDIADVNPKWLTDILGPWEFIRTPNEIQLNAIDRKKKISTSFRFTPERPTYSQLQWMVGNRINLTHQLKLVVWQKLNLEIRV